MHALASAHTVLAVQPHYDDNDIACAGTVALLAARGCAVHYLTVTDDVAGVLDPDIADHDARIALRNEAARAGALLGVASHSWLDHPDAQGFDHHTVRDAVIATIRAVRPDVVLTCDPWLTDEGHSDHVRTGLAAVEAALLAGLPRLCRDTPDPAHAVGSIALCYTTAPNTLVDTSAVQVVRHRALDEYRMQFTPDDLVALHTALERHERRSAPEGATHAEALFVAPAGAFHCGRTHRGAPARLLQLT